MSQVKVQWVAKLNLYDKPWSGLNEVPVIPLASLVEVVEGMKACKLALESCKAQICGALPRMEVESAIDEAQRLLAMLEETPKQDSGSNK